MKKKNLWLMLICVVLIVAMTSTMFIGCKPKRVEISGGDFGSVLTTGIVNSIEGDPDVKDFFIKVNFDITVKNGDATSSKYNIFLGANLDLDKSADSKDNRLRISVKDDKGIVLDAVYNEQNDPSYNVYLQARLKDGTMLKKAIQAVGIKHILQNNTADDLTIEVGQSASDIVGYLGLAATMVCTQATRSKDFKNLTATVPLTDLLSAGDLYELVAGLGDMAPFTANVDKIVDGEYVLDENGNREQVTNAIDTTVGGMINKLGLDLDFGKLGELLPKISLGLTLETDGNYDKKTDTFDDIKMTKLSGNLSVGKKEIKLNKTAEKGGGALLTINLANDVSVEMGGTFEAGVGDASKIDAPIPADYASYDKIGVGNAKIAGTLELKTAVNESIAGVVDIAIPAGTYDLTLNLDIDPTKLIGVNFAEPDILKLIKGILPVINKAEIKMASADLTAIDIAMAKNNKGNVALTREGQVNILGSMNSLVNALLKEGADLTALVDGIANIIPKAEAGAATDDKLVQETPEQSTEKFNQTIANVSAYLMPLTIVLNSSGLTVDYTKTTIWGSDGLVLTDIAANAALNKDGLTLTVKASKFVGTGADDPNQGRGLDLEAVIKITSFKLFQY